MIMRTLLRAVLFALLGFTLVACDSGSSGGTGDDGDGQETPNPTDLGFCDQFTASCGSWLDATSCADWWAAAAPGTATDTTGATQGCYEHHLNLATASAGNPAALAGYCANAAGRADSAGNSPCVDARLPPVCAEPAPCTAGSKGCDANVAWECVYDSDSCPAKDTIEDCGAKNQICTAGGICDVDPNTQSSGILCGEFDQCLVEACPAPAGQQPDQTCIQSAFTNTCSPQAETPAETNLYLALNQCLGTNCADAATQPQLFECIRTNCLTPFATCQAGTFGTEGCGGIEACLNQNGCVAPTGVLDAGCARTCLSAASAAANEQYWDVNMCVLAACSDSADPSTCLNQALNSPTCSEPYIECQGDTG